MRQAEIARLLPWVFQRTLRDGEPLAASLGVMEQMHARPEAILAEIDVYIDPRRAPDAMVPYLARWVDLAWLVLDPPDDPTTATVQPFPAGHGRLRELVAAAAPRAKARGTIGGLVRFLETATGLSGFAIVEDPPDAQGNPRPFHVLVQAPFGAERFRELIALIVESEKPAHVTFDPAEIEFADARPTASRDQLPAPEDQPTATHDVVEEPPT